MPLLPTAGPPMPGMATMPMGPQVQPSPMMDPDQAGDMGGGMMPPGMGGPPGGSSPTQSIVMALLANQAKSDGVSAQIMGQGAAEMQASAQQSASAIQALIASMATQPNPMAVGAQTEPAPAYGSGLPPDPNAPPGGLY